MTQTCAVLQPTSTAFHTRLAWDRKIIITTASWLTYETMKQLLLSNYADKMGTHTKYLNLAANVLSEHVSAQTMLLMSGTPYHPLLISAR